MQLRFSPNLKVRRCLRIEAAEQAREVAILAEPEGPALPTVDGATTPDRGVAILAEPEGPALPWMTCGYLINGVDLKKIGSSPSE